MIPELIRDPKKPWGSYDAQKMFENFIFYSPDGCWYWTGRVDTHGYGRFVVNTKSYIASRLSFKIYKSDPGTLDVCHSCDNPICVNPNHLYAGTPSQNILEAIRKGRKIYKRGVDTFKCRITEDQVRNIKGLLSIGLTTRFISQARKVTIPTVHAIKRGSAWKHI